MPLPDVPRRIFLKRSLQALGTLAALPLLPSGCRRDPGDPVPELRTFTAREYAILEAAADTFVPDGGPGDPGARSVGLAARIDAELAEEDPRVVSALRSALWVLEVAAPALAMQVGFFSRLDPDGRAATLAALPHRFGLARDVYGGLKQTCIFFFYCADESWPATGYDGPWVERRVAGSGT